MVHAEQQSSPNSLWFTLPGVTERFIELHGDGLGFTVIAEKLTAEFQTVVTKNACVGKARRLGLPRRERPKAGLYVRKRKRNPPAGPPRRDYSGRFARKTSVPLPEPELSLVSPSIVPPAVPRRELRIADLPVLELRSGQCRYPYGEYPYGFCGRRPLDSPSYCREHAAICHGRAA